MFKRIIALTVLVITAFSLCACAKKEEPALPSSSPEPIAKEEPKKEAIVKEFSDGRLYAEGDIISFAETENYYFTVDTGTEDWLSIYSRSGEFVCSSKILRAAKTDIYPLSGDRVAYVDCDNFYIIASVETDENGNYNIVFDSRRRACPDNVGISVLPNKDGYYDVYSTGWGLACYGFNAQEMFVDEPVYIDLPSGGDNIVVSHVAANSVVGDSDLESAFVLGYREVLGESYNHGTMISMLQNNEIVNTVYFAHEHDTAMEIACVGDFLVYANTAVYDATGDIINRLFVLDKNLNTIFTKDYIGVCPVEAVAAGDNIAVSLYKNGGDKSSCVEILDCNGNTVETIEHSLFYARLLSDKNGGFYITGKQGESFESNVNTIAFRYNENAEQITQTLFNTENDYDKGFGLYFEVNNAGELVALQGNIKYFPLNLADKSKSRDILSERKWLVSSEKFSIYNPNIPAKGKNKFMYPGEKYEFIVLDGRYYITSDQGDKRYLSAFNEKCERLWCTEIPSGRFTLSKFKDMLVLTGGRKIYAFNASDGKYKWGVLLDESCYYNIISVFADKIVCLYDRDPEFEGDITNGACYVYADGTAEYVPYPEIDFGNIDMVSPRLYDIVYREDLGGNYYGNVSNSIDNAYALFNENFEVISSIEYPKNLYAFPHYHKETGRIYFSGQDYSRGERFNGFIYVYDASLNKLFSYDFENDTGADLVKILDDGRFIVKTYDVTEYGGNINKHIWLMDVYGNKTELEDFPPSVGEVYETKNGYVAIEYNFKSQFVYRFNKNFEITGSPQQLKNILAVDYEGNLITN